MNFREFKARLLSGHQKHFTAREMKAMTSGVRIDGLPVEYEFVKPGWKFCHPDAKHVDKYISAQVFYRAWQKVLGTSSKAPRKNAPKPNISRPHRASWISNSGMLQCVIVEKKVDSLNSPLFVGSVFGVSRDGILGEVFAESNLEQVQNRLPCFRPGQVRG